MATENMNIGQRAVQCIRGRAEENGTTFKHECELLGISNVTALQWHSYEKNPRTDILAEMCRQGYDMTYILIGERK